LEKFIEFFFDNIVLFIIAFLSGSLLIWPFLTQGLGIKKIGTLETTQLLNSSNAILLDLREDDNVHLGIIPQAIRLPQSKFDELYVAYKKKFTDNLKKTKKPIILILNDNKYSSKIEKRFEVDGFKEIYKLDGGINAWVEAGFPLKK
jgi:rhodanese-related sulfurtransferase